MLLNLLFNIPVVSSPHIFTIGFVGVFIFRKFYETTQECFNDDDCLFYPKCCLDHCCDFNEYNSRVIPIYVNNK